LRDRAGGSRKHSDYNWDGGEMSERGREGENEPEVSRVIDAEPLLRSRFDPAISSSRS